ncbi:MAG: DUF475 domain-containing protein [Pseudomonadota bacterium]|nr:DUF475 domain-containing protein [Pseudomonadota bacterium]
MQNWRYFKGSLLVTVLGLIAGYFYGFYFYGTVSGALKTVFLVAILTVLEISLSFDNAVVNATILRKMTDLWRQRFLTWGIAIAVFGMRLVFPLAIISIVAHLNPYEALMLAATQPLEYERIMKSVHIEIGAFGGFFLLMVCLKYFFDASKEVHWIKLLETGLSRAGRIEAIEIVIALIALVGASRFLQPHDREVFLIAGLIGIIIFIVVEGIGDLLQISEDVMADAQKASAMMFVYLELIDASFSLDGVIGAFALTNNLFIIAIGLGVGAMFVRSLTILLVEQGTLSKYKYLEHGAFYAIGSLAVLMVVNTFRNIPEAVTGLIGAAFIGLSLMASRIELKKR